MDKIEVPVMYYVNGNGDKVLDDDLMLHHFWRKFDELNVLLKAKETE